MPRDSKKLHRQRMAMHQQCLEIGVWDDDTEFRLWLKEEFGVKSRTQLTEKQQVRYWRWMNHFLNGGSAPALRAGGVTKRQLAKINHLSKSLGFNESDLCGFIERQTGERMLQSALKKGEASKVIVGLERLKLTRGVG